MRTRRLPSREGGSSSSAARQPLAGETASPEEASEEAETPEGAADVGAKPPSGKRRRITASGGST